MKANHKITIAALAGLALSAFMIIVSDRAALAQDMVRVRGTIESIDGPTYLIKARDGAELKVALADKARSPRWSRHRLPISNRACLWA
jgi:hypothetical protein